MITMLVCLIKKLNQGLRFFNKFLVNFPLKMSFVDAVIYYSFIKLTLKYYYNKKIIRLAIIKHKITKYHFIDLNVNICS